VKSPRRGLGLGVLLAVAAGLVLHQPAAAQSAAELLGELRLEYQGAVSVHEAAQAALQVIDRRFNAALLEIDNARRDRDDVARREALSAAQARTAPLADARNRVDVAADSLRSVRLALIEVLIVRQVELIELADGASSSQERREFDNILRVVSNELAAREDDIENDVSLDPVAMPDIAIDPRDGPTELLGKAEILEVTAVRVDTLILSIDEEISQLESRRDMERSRRDFLAGTGRFGDLQPPTGTTGGADPTVQATDSIAAGGRPVTLEDRIEARRVYRQILIDQRELLLFRARDFRVRVRRRS
jgi:hypothetical protein